MSETQGTKREQNDGADDGRDELWSPLVELARVFKTPNFNFDFQLLYVNDI